MIRLVAPRNVEAITVPTSGPESSAVSGESETASGRTSAAAGPFGVAASTRGNDSPRTLTRPSRTSP